MQRVPGAQTEAMAAAAERAEGSEGTLAAGEHGHHRLSMAPRSSLTTTELWSAGRRRLLTQGDGIATINVPDVQRILVGNKM